MTEERAIQKYGTRSDIKELGERVKRFLPNGDKMSAEEAIGFAQIAIAQNLNPFAGEMWYVPGVGSVTGIDGLRKLARRQGYFNAEKRPMTPEEREQHGVKDGDWGAICELYRPDVLMEAVKVNEAAGEVVIPIKPTVGIGVKRANERNKYTPTGRSMQWVAEKRAEADALRKAFNISISYGEIAAGNGSVVETDLPQWAVEELEGPEPIDVERGKALLQGDPVTGEIVDDEEPEVTTPELRPNPVDDTPNRLKEAMAYTTSKGTRLGQCSLADLRQMLDKIVALDNPDTEAKTVKSYLEILIEYMERHLVAASQQEMEL